MHSISFNASYCVYLTPPSVVPPGPPTVPLRLPAFAYFYFFQWLDNSSNEDENAQRQAKLSRVSSVFKGRDRKD